MTLDDLVWSDETFPYDLKIKAMSKILKFLEENKTGGSEVLINRILSLAADYESDDFFGTEGLEIG